jgi:hypothetical protein
MSDMLVRAHLISRYTAGIVYDAPLETGVSARGLRVSCSSARPLAVELMHVVFPCILVAAVG